ncbi:caspase family protein [Streptomyces sp. NBC_00091]|uniref:caspase family protein n=1 Tax=Streptomyces sp. NBC_00091 TaxID=2975648 RepID=UPI00224D7283|nr:caspase family protein [Streptomyces sp. NBC_00091]MCX5379392.1 caspase family protein [Streptomyces sp. NBC_00091]
MLIGTATYTSRDLGAIPHSPRNIRGLAAALTDRTVGGFAVRDVRLVDDPREPQDIMRPVAAAAEQAEDVLLVYYSGHGLLTGANSDFHLSLRGSEPDQPWTSLAFSYPARLVKQSRAAVKIVILDCCFSGRAHADLMSAESRLIRDQLAVTGVYSLTSAPENRLSKAPEGDTYSAFTGFLLTTMWAGVPGAGPVLGMSDLYEEVRRRMRDTDFPLPEHCDKTGAGALPLLRNRYSPPPVPQPASHTPPRAVAPYVPAPQATTPTGRPSFDSVEGAGYRMGEVLAGLDDVIAVVADARRWSQAKPPYFPLVSNRKTHGFDVGQVNAHIERHRHQPTTFVDALRLLLMLQGLVLAPVSSFRGWRVAAALKRRCEMAPEEQSIGHATTSTTRNVAFSDTHLYLLNGPDLLKVPYSRLGDLSVSVSSGVERWVSYSDQGGSSGEVLVVTSTVNFGYRTVEFRESDAFPVQEALGGCLPALADLRRRHPEWFAAPVRP